MPSGHMRSPLNITTGTAAAIVGAVAIACGAGAYLYSLHHFQSVLQSARTTALAQGQLIRAGLEHQMMENDRSLIERMIKSFGHEANVETLMILDREGRVRYSSGSVEPGTDLSISSPTCQACHRLPPEQRDSSQIIETSQGTILRTVIPFRNLETCHRCHDPSHRINGILIEDMDVGAIRAGMNRDLRWMVAGSAVIALLLVVAIALILRVFLVRRLLRFETTARRIAGGDLQQRVPAEGSDTLAWLGREFNTMADSVTGLLGEVRVQREQLEMVINSIDDGIVVLDVERRIVAANDAFLRRVGRDRHAMIGSSCRDTATGTCGAGDCPTQACLLSGSPQVRVCERTAPDGKPVWEEVHASPIRRGNGAIVQVVEVWRDITDRRAAEARLAESHRLASLGMLASGFSHELNTPLATILTCVEGIQRTLKGDGALDPEGRRRITEGASTAREQLLRCRGITQHFLRLSRGQAAPADLVEIEPVAAAVTRLIEPTARAHQVTIEMAPMPPGLRVRANEADLQHILLNLLLNAVQACEKGGRVVLGASGDRSVLITVRDNGRGIPPGDRARIFEPFFSGRQGGTGLGLFLSLEFVRRSGGDISVQSVPGSGSTFQVELPAADASASLRVLS